LLFRAEGLRAVTIDANHKTHLQPIAIGRDYGTSLEVLQGLKADDWIVVNPADSLDEGVQVNVKQLPQPAPAGTPGAQGGGSASGSGNDTKNGTAAPSGNKPPISNGGSGTPKQQ
jgi:hypothetical protein